MVALLVLVVAVAVVAGAVNILLTPSPDDADDGPAADYWRPFERG
jgi:hypothetical protein